MKEVTFLKIKMGCTTSRSDKKAALNERALLHSAWVGIGNNPQYHGNVFFSG